MFSYAFPNQVTTSADSPVAPAPTRPRALLQAERDECYKAEIIRSLDPKSYKEQTWKKNNWSEAWQIERAAEAARPKQEPGLERDSGPSR